MQALRHNQLVYIPFSKIASTSYTELFQNRLGWESISVDHIDWESDIVFAHLIHPYDRHAKGIQECIKKYNLESILDDPRFLKLLGTAVFDLHSYPISVGLGDKNSHKIEWLILDSDQISGDELTKVFLASHGIATNGDIPHLTKASPAAKDMVNKIKDMRDAANLTGTLTYFYQQDLVLYNQVYENTLFCEIHNMPWVECSWLRTLDKNT